MTSDEALAWLRSQGASPWLVRHHELVVEAAHELLAGLRGLLPTQLDHQLVLVGCALHDVGKIEHGDEMRAPGHAHEEAGRALLVRHGHPNLSRFAVTHARWSDAEATMEDRLVALADKLWKGKREERLEAALIDEIASATGRERWEVFATFDEVADAVAARGPERLARSAI